MTAKQLILPGYEDLVDNAVEIEDDIYAISVQTEQLTSVNERAIM